MYLGKALDGTKGKVAGSEGMERKEVRYCVTDRRNCVYPKWRHNVWPLHMEWMRNRRCIGAPAFEQEDRISKAYPSCDCPRVRCVAHGDQA